MSYQGQNQGYYGPPPPNQQYGQYPPPQQQVCPEAQLRDSDADGLG